MDRRLTTREREIVYLIYLARGTREIAATLGIRVQTAKNHLRNIFRKLGITNRIDLAIYAMGEIERLASAESRPRSKRAKYRFQPLPQAYPKRAVSSLNPARL